MADGTGRDLRSTRPGVRVGLRIRYPHVLTKPSEGHTHVHRTVHETMLNGFDLARVAFGTVRDGACKLTPGHAQRLNR